MCSPSFKLYGIFDTTNYVIQPSKYNVTWFIIYMHFNLLIFSYFQLLKILCNLIYLFFVILNYWKYINIVIVYYSIKIIFLSKLTSQNNHPNIFMKVSLKINTFETTDLNINHLYPNQILKNHVENKLLFHHFSQTHIYDILSCPTQWWLGLISFLIELILGQFVLNPII